MDPKIIIILTFFFSSYYVLAQPGRDAFPPPGGLSSIELLDVEKQKKTRINPAGKPLSLFIFLSPECPLSQNYTKTINQLQETFSRRVNLYGIIPGNAYSVKDVADFENKYQTGFKILIDTKQELTRYLEATVTPQAILLDNKDNLVYTGAIDDWVQGPGKRRLYATQHYVKNAIEQSLRSEAVKIKKTKVFGCKINDY